MLLLLGKQTFLELKPLHTGQNDHIEETDMSKQSELNHMSSPCTNSMSTVALIPSLKDLETLDMSP